MGSQLAVDYLDESTLLSTLTFSAYEKQKDIIKAAKTAGVKLFVTSEYGLPTDDVATGAHSIN